MTVDSISTDHWTTQEAVADKINIQLQDSEKDYTTEIEEATDSVQSWYQDETGVADSDLPSTDADVDSLLQQAAAWEAASEAYFKFSQNVQNGDDASRDESLHRKARRKFKDWKSSEDVEPESKTDSDLSYSGKSGSLTSDLFGGSGGR